MLPNQLGMRLFYLSVQSYLWRGESNFHDCQFLCQYQCLLDREIGNLELIMAPELVSCGQYHL